MSVKYRFLVIFGILIIFVAGGIFAWQYFGRQEVELKDETANWKTYTNATFKYSIKYPDGYEVMQKTASQIGPDQNVCITGRGESTCKLILNGIPLSRYKLIDNPGGFVFYFDVNKKQWLHDKTNDTSQFVPKRIEGSIEAYTYKTGDIKCLYQYTLIPAPSYDTMIEISNAQCTDDEGNPLPGYDDFSTDQILSTFKFTDLIENPSSQIFDPSEIFSITSFTDSSGNKKKVVVRRPIEFSGITEVYITDENLALDSAKKIGEGWDISIDISPAYGSKKAYIVIQKVGPGDTANLSIVDENGKILEESLGGKIQSQVQYHGLALPMLTLFFFDSWEDSQAFYVVASSFVDLPLRFKLLVEAETGRVIEKQLISAHIWSEQDAIDIVSWIPEVRNWLGTFTGSGRTNLNTGGEAFVEIEKKGGGVYVVHAFELVSGERITHSKYSVNPVTGEIKENI